MPTTDPRLIDAVRDLPAIGLDAEEVTTIRAQSVYYDANATEALRVLLCGIHELCIELERSHARNAPLGARLADVTDQRDALRWPHMWAMPNSERDTTTECIYCKQPYGQAVGVPCPRARANYERLVAWERDNGEGTGVNPANDPYGDEYVRTADAQGEGG